MNTDRGFQIRGLVAPPSEAVMFEELNETRKKYTALKTPPRWYCFSPGRLNLIGEHIDYCGGHVMPAAISMGTFAIASPLKDKSITVYSSNFSGQKSFTLATSEYAESDGWINYPKGIFHLLQQIFPGKITHGLEIFLSSSLPMASGLSSSASLLLCILQIAKQVYDLRFDADETEDKRQTARFAQKVENEYIGLNCGILDHGGIVFGKKNCFMLMDCPTLDIEYLPFPNNRYTLVICNTNKPRKLSESKYNERKTESEEALENIRSKFNVNNLCEIGENRKEQALDTIKNPTVRKRATHIINENQRVYQVKAALKNNNPVKLGKLLTEGHLSLKENYEVTGKELDSIVIRALNQPGVLGARMTGAGFSGCALILAEKEHIEKTLSSISEAYSKDTGLTCAFYPCIASDGVKTVPLPMP